MENRVQEFYGNRLRCRVCGISVVQNKILLINHSGISKGNFWSPPGGGMQFGESGPDCLRREFKEETGLEIKVGEFLFACELLRQPLHAVELFFKVEITGGLLTTGVDPEKGSPGIIQEARYLSWEEVNSMPPDSLHGIFRVADTPSQVTQLKGYFKL